jgi:3'-phosphoadenosine 5'-phosphosulfate sulfotransferase (PAPS reductase)/FAD synthetase
LTLSNLYMNFSFRKYSFTILQLITVVATSIPTITTTPTKGIHGQINEQQQLSKP